MDDVGKERGKRVIVDQRQVADPFHDSVQNWTASDLPRRGLSSGLGKQKLQTTKPTPSLQVSVHEK